ncbi:hypothetical protein ABI59_00225 [Acidobacteria bacterium Mor1]|nr:hypothetical protein ABI59_00225 [Acidobacteria bacterium Mor1]
MLTRNRNCALLVVMIVACALGTSALAGDAETVQADVRKIADAAYQRDVETTLAYTHPKILEIMGGPEGARKVMNDLFNQMGDIKMTLESMTFPDPPQFIAGAENEYVIVPTLSVVSVGGQKLRSVNFQFGSRPKGGSGWKYVEGSRVSPQLLAALFPDFPADHKLPEVARERM